MRLLDELEEQHLRGNRRENGSLMAQYDDLVKRGISRGVIPATIKEGERRGLIEAKQSDAWPLKPDGKQPPNRYRLTYLPSCTTDAKGVETWSLPTDEWRSFSNQRARNGRRFGGPAKAFWPDQKWYSVRYQRRYSVKKPK